MNDHASPARSARLPPGRLRFAWRLLANPDPLSRLSVFDADDSDLVGWTVGRQQFFVSRSPSHVEHVFITANAKYRKSVHYRLLAAVTGEGLLTNEGEAWARQRKLVQPMLAKRQLRDLAPHMTAATADFLARLGGRGESGTVDVAAAMSELTLDVVGRALFGATLVDAAPRLRPAVVVGLNTAIAGAYFQQLLAIPGWLVDRIGRLIFHLPILPPPLGRVRSAMRAIDEIVHEVIDSRTANPEQANDLLGLLLAARDEEGHAMSRRQIRDEVVTLMLAGHETTANGLAWMWYLLSLHPEARRRLYREIDDIVGGRTPTADDVERLVWASACFQEAMRLYPPAWVLEREALVDDELDGTRIPAGATIIFPVYAIHRDPRWWPEPEAFDPNRFLEDDSRRPRGAYLPFGAGRRICVGAGFALMEAALITAMITQRLELDLAPEAKVVPQATVTLRPRHGLPMIVRRRVA